eukprot:UN07638
MRFSQNFDRKLLAPKPMTTCVQWIIYDLPASLCQLRFSIHF